MKKCVFAGTFDPFTVGHEDTVKKSLLVFDEVVVAVAENPRKQTMFTAEERKQMIECVYKDQPRVKVVVWNRAIVDLLASEDTVFYVRGVRNAIDCDYETADFYASRDLSGDMICMYFPSEQEHLHVSSTLVKNCILFGKNYEKYVPQEVYRYVQKNRG